MIKFFRKIRQSLLSENKVSKYLVYAVGEIILVVIGILIALQFNNWNNQRAQDNKTIAIFNQIVDELIIDIDVLNDASGFYIYKDSLIEIYKNADLNNLPRKNDSVLDEDNLIHMIRTFTPVEIHDRGFNLLMANSDQMDKRYKAYVDELVYLYQDAKPGIELYYERLKNVLYEHRMHKIKNHTWYSRMGSDNKPSQEEFDYYKFDPIYKNYVQYYNDMVYNLAIQCRAFEDLAIKFCRRINADFKLDRDLDKVLHFKYPPEDLLSEVKKSYLLDADTLSFKVKNRTLYETTFDNRDLAYIYKKELKVGELRYLGNRTFFRNMFSNLRIDEDGTLQLLPINKLNPVALKPILND